MYLLGILLYVLVCGTIAWLVAKLLTRRAKVPWARWAVSVVLAPVVFFLPLADEIVGHFQFERLCESAKEVKVYGTIPVGEDLYTPEGKWRLALPEGDAAQRPSDSIRLQKIVETYLRKEYRRLPDIRAAIDIWAEETKIYDATSNRLLAEYRSFGTNKGWVSRTMLPSEFVVLGRKGCGPTNFWELQQSLLKFNRP